MYISTDRNIKKPLITQIYEQIKEKILSGDLKENFKLPSSRELSKNLGVSRNIVLEAYDQLIAEGYIVSKTGDGTYVTKGLKFKTKEPNTNINLKHKGFKSFNDSIVDFRSGLPDLTYFPTNKWLKYTKEVLNEASPETLAYGQPEGSIELRRAIADYIRIYRGVNCNFDQIIITGGTTQGIGLVSRAILSDTNKDIVLEDPVTIDIQEIISSFGGVIHGVEVDKEGLKTECLPEAISPRAIFVTPSHHYPLGVTLSIKRRIELIKYARNNNSYIVEDDYDSEFRYDVQPTPSLQGLAPSRVIYMGTFSKTLCPALRVGYVIFPPELIERGREIKWQIDLHNSVIDQLILAKLINSGDFHRSILRMKKSHRRKRKVLIDSLVKVFNTKVEILGSAVGIHLAVKFSNVIFSKSLLNQLESMGVRIYPVAEHTIRKETYLDTVIMGFGFLSDDDIKKGVEIISRALPT